MVRVLYQLLQYRRSFHQHFGGNRTFLPAVSIVLLALAASEILIGNAPAMAYVTTATVFGLIAIIYFCFIYPDGDMINNMRKIFPIAGFAFLMASFWSQSFAPAPWRISGRCTGNNSDDFLSADAFLRGKLFC